jgi:hypothetical protein
VRNRLGTSVFGFSLTFLVLGQLVAGCDSKSNGDDDDGGSSGEDGARAGSSPGKGGKGGAAQQPAKGGSNATGGSATGGSATGGSATGGSATGGNATGGSATGGNGTGGSATGGGSAAGGSGNPGTGGTSGAAGGGDEPGGTGGTVIGPTCDAIDIRIELETPTVMLLVDTSSSMFEQLMPVYPLLHDALMNPADGVVKSMQNSIRFGFSSYKGFQASSETDVACAAMETVAPALDNYDAIEDVYGAIASAGWDMKQKWETPTNHAINRTTAALLDDMPDVPSSKYILLVTDGNPNTCATLDPQCGQDLAIKAAQDAHDNGVGLMVLGVGDIVENPNSGCDAAYIRCGLDHLQDMANAGVGAAVQSPPHCDDPTSASCTYRYSECSYPEETLKASYTPSSPDVGHYVAIDTTDTAATTLIAGAVSDLLNAVTSCTFHMNVTVTGDASSGVVKLAGTDLVYGDANGWEIGPSSHELALRGTACDAFTDGAKVQIDLPCDQVEPL